MKNSWCATARKYPDFLYGLSLSNNDRTETPFEELSDAEKEKFAQLWKEHNIKVVAEKLEKDPVLREVMETDVQSFESAYNSVC